MFHVTEDDGDRDVLRTVDAVLTIPGFVPNEYMALTVMVEYHFGIPSAQGGHLDSAAMIKKTKGTMEQKLTYLTLGAALFIPSDGETIQLRNTDHDPGEDAEGVDVELRLTRDEVCSILSPKPALQDQDPSSQPPSTAADKRDSLSGAPVSVSRSANNFDFLKQKSGVSSSVDVQKSVNRDGMNLLELDETDFSDGIMAGFELRAIHSNPAVGEIKHNDNIESLVKMPSSDGEKAKDGESADADIIGKLRFEPEDRLTISLRDSISSSRPLQASFAGKSATGQMNMSFTSKNGKATIRNDDLPGSRFQDDDTEAVASIVTGDSEHSSVRLDFDLYRARQRRKEFQQHQSGIDFNDHIPEEDKYFRAPRNKNSLLAQSLQTKLISHGQSDKNARLFGDRERIAPLEMNTAPNTAIVIMNGNAAYTRDLTRGARSRLSRFGFEGALQDTPLPQSIVVVGVRSTNAIDWTVEVNDPLSIHEVSIQFAGCRFGSLVYAAQHETLAAFYDKNTPKRVYFSFQFYTCMPTRTEILRLVQSDRNEKGKSSTLELSVLTRDDAFARNEPPLILRYIVDCSPTTAPNIPHAAPAAVQSTEAIEFAEYLSREALYVDVWDADSLMLLGTCGIPLKKLLRQQRPLVKMAIECDIIDYEAGASCEPGLTTCTVTDGGPIAGDIVGAVQVIITNSGRKGSSSEYKSQKTLKGSEEKQSMDEAELQKSPLELEGLNWRAYGVYRDPNEQRKSVNGLGRPTNIIRARPLAESAPELAKALVDVRDSHFSPRHGGSSMRSLTASRGANTSNTLTYDEVAILFKRFQGAGRGTVQYSGTLMNLLDMPSWAVSLRKLVQAYKTFGDHEGFRLVRHFLLSE